MKPKKLQPPDALQIAIGLLARRQHSEWQWRQKLPVRGCATQNIIRVIAYLLAKKRLPELRLIGSCVRDRKTRGDGPMQIMAQMQARSVRGQGLALFNPRAVYYWRKSIRKWYDKHDQTKTTHRKGYAQPWRFFCPRGFSGDQIHFVLDQPWT